MRTEVGWKGNLCPGQAGLLTESVSSCVESGSCQWPVPTHTRCSVFSVEFMNDLGEKIKERMLARNIWILVWRLGGDADLKRGCGMQL